jgi:flagellar motor switch protein FliG
MSNATTAENRETGLTQIQKAAILLLTVGEQESVEILKTLEEEEIMALGKEIAAMGSIPEFLARQVQEEFLHACHTRKSRRGGLDKFKKLVGDARGELPTIAGEPGAFLSKLEPSLLANILRDEHSQTMALILSAIRTEKARAVIALLPAKAQADVVIRMATLGKVKSGVIAQIEEVIREQIVSDSRGTRLKAGGIDMVAAALNNMARNTGERIITDIEEANPDLAELIKARMFTFDDLVKLTDQAMQVLLRETKSDDLAIALRTASTAFQDKVYGNMSERAGAILKENIDTMGPVKLSEVEAAQMRIAMTAKKLGDEGKILLNQENEKLVK